MHLHDRVVRAGFFNHAQFVLSFTRDERLFYEGLFLLADDSHCLLDDPYEFKLHLFPMDSDITPETLVAWRDKFVAAGKLIPYTAQGKRCLYLANGREHQSQQQNLERPDVPLPAWVTWKPYPKNAYRGTYEHGEPETVGAESLSEPTLSSKQCIAEIEAKVSTGLGLNQDRDWDGDTGKGAPPVEAPADSPGADAPPPPVDGMDHPGEPEPQEPAGDPLAAPLARLRHLPGYKPKDDDLSYLQDLTDLYPDVDLEREIAKCGEWFAGRDDGRRRNWRSGIRNWVHKAASPPQARASPMAPRDEATRIALRVRGG